MGQDEAIFLAKSLTLFVRSFMHLLVTAKPVAQKGVSSDYSE
jgi:hypothetical protein